MSQANEESTVLERLERLESIHEIKQLMGRRAYLHAASLHGRELDECWAQETPGMTFEAEDYGVWKGLESIRKAYVDGMPPVEPGLLVEHCLTTEVIEIADDGNTAKGVWISPGHETFPVPGRTPIAHWSWGRYAVDFVKERGAWKIWHLHVLTTFRTPYDQDWVDSSINRPAHLQPLGETLPGMHAPDGPVTFNQPYSVDVTPVLQPEPPAPYKTFESEGSQAR
ncbi:MAG: nuclear transport factor 2 family protein [Thermoleophilia bacterium]|nr:nuclear transport factor 2 family protein [Thermoleophilia bacterium]